MEFAAFRDIEKILPLHATSFSYASNCLCHTSLGSGESPELLLNDYLGTNSDVPPGSRSDPRLALEQAGDNRPDSILESPLAQLSIIALAFVDVI